METEQRTRLLRIVIVAAGLVCLVLIWLLPAVGLVVTALAAMVVPTWGRSVAERTVVSALVLLGAMSILFSRIVSLPINATSAHLVLSAFVALAVGLRVWRPRASTLLPRPTLSDALLVVLALGLGFWLLRGYYGQSLYATVSGLFFSGWDNQGHFTAFANTFVSGSDVWPTVDGDIAWNQWYPNLHATVWSLAQYATGITPSTRAGLLQPYVVWSALTFTACMTALAWVAGDVARRWALARDRSPREASIAATMAVILVSAWALLGSPQLLFNAGFTNFVLAVTVAVVASWLCLRSWRAAATIGPFLAPLACTVVIGLWTPLVVCLAPAGIAVLLALWRRRRWWAVVWVASSAGVVGLIALGQINAMLFEDPSAKAGEYNAQIGAVGAGMIPFNIGAGMLAPLIAIGLAIIAWRSRIRLGWLAVIGPTLGAAALAVFFGFGATAAQTPWYGAYYVLKAMYAALAMTAPFLAAAIAVVSATVLLSLNRVTAGVSAAVGGLVVVGSFGYVGALPLPVLPGYWAAPGIQAGIDRMRGIEDPLTGEAIINAAVAAYPYPERATLLWDGAGILPNMWVASLTGTISAQQQRFYAGLPAFPYDEATARYVDFSLTLAPSMNLAILWFRGVSNELLTQAYGPRADDRVILVQVPMRSSVLCQECRLDIPVQSD